MDAIPLPDRGAYWLPWPSRTRGPPCPRTVVQEPEATGFRISPQQETLLTFGGERLRTRCVVELDRALGSEPIERRMRSAILQHGILRTAFRRVPGLASPVQVIAAAPAEGA